MPVLAFSMSQQIADAAATDVMLFVCRLFCKEICSKQFLIKGKGKVFPYSLPSVGPGADPGVQAVSPQVT